MALTKYKIGDLVTIVDERNELRIKEFYGININKEFMPTVANTEGLDESKYKVVRENRFVYSGMQTGRDECIRISMYSKENPILVSPAYTTFEISALDIVIPTYFFMIFLSKEKDRYGAFCSDGSIRSNLDWEVFCDIDIDLPPLPIQQKYVDVYNAMLANQKSYEKGLDDLKLTCDAYIEDLRRKMPCESIGPYIGAVNESNTDKTFNFVQGVESGGSFIDTRANMQGVDVSNYTIVRKNCIVYNPSRINIGSIAKYGNEKPCIVSPMYSVFKVLNVEKILPEYLMLWFGRKEFHRYTWYYAAGSVRDTFDFNLMEEVKLPLPEINIQQDIVNMYNAYNKRKAINERLKTQIKDICPILIKGSIEEARRGENVHATV